MNHLGKKEHTFSKRLFAKKCSRRAKVRVHWVDLFYQNEDSTQYIVEQHLAYSTAWRYSATVPNYRFNEK